MTVQWTDLVDPTREELLRALPGTVDEDVITALLEPPGDGRAARPGLTGHGTCVRAVLVHPRMTAEGRAAYLVLDVVASPSALVTVRKSGPDGEVAPVDGVGARVDAGVATGDVFQAAVDDSADAFLELVDGLYEAIDGLEGEVEHQSGAHVRRRIALLRSEILLARRTSTATRGVARRIVDGRIDVGRSELFPPEIEVRFVDTYETLVRVTEELDVARDLLGGVRDYYQAKIAEQQNEVAKKLTVIASLVLVPSLIVGFYGQNFAGEFREWYWGIGISVGLIVATTVVQLVLFRWRRWL
ncbi:MAG TPA: CorA family divalent cation transporter [Gaiella sp.]|nr:CorA family divalent cation transporter [Gaiella sp.]